MLRSVIYRFLRVRETASKLVELNQYQNCGVPGSSDVTFYRFMAGHSKWQNIRHVKAAKDKEKSILHGKYSHLIRLAVRDKGPDPVVNSRLAGVLEEARKHGVPVAVTENAVKKAFGGKIKSGMIEILGPGGCYVILDYETDSISDTRHKIKGICKKYSASLPAGEGRWRTFYTQKGILRVTHSNDGQALDAETALDVAVEAGAEDVQLRTGEDEVPFLEFYCDPSDIFIVKKEVEKSYSVEEAYVGFIPNITIELSDNDMDVASSFLADLAELPEAVRIYENVQ